MNWIVDRVCTCFSKSLDEVLHGDCLSSSVISGQLFHASCNRFEVITIRWPEVNNISAIGNRDTFHSDCPVFQVADNLKGMPNCERLVVRVRRDCSHYGLIAEPQIRGLNCAGEVSVVARSNVEQVSRDSRGRCWQTSVPNKTERIVSRISHCFSMQVEYNRASPSMIVLHV